MSDLTFSTAAVPEQIFTKAAEPNPFEDAVKALVESMGDAEQSVSASVAVVPTEEVAKRVRQVQALGEPLGVTVRKKIEDQGDGTSTLTFWTTKRIVRPRKPKEDAAK